MLTESEKKFASKVVELGFATSEQVEDTIKVQEKLIELGIEKDLSGVMLDKKYLQPKEVLRVTRRIEYEDIKEIDNAVIKVLKTSGLLSDEEIVKLRKTQKKISLEDYGDIPTMEVLIAESNLLTEQQLASLNINAKTVSLKREERNKIQCPFCNTKVIPIDYKCPQCGNIIQLEFQDLDKSSDSLDVWVLKFYNPKENKEVTIETEYNMIKDWILTGFVTQDAEVKKELNKDFIKIGEVEVFKNFFKTYKDKKDKEKEQIYREVVKKSMMVVIPVFLIALLLGSSIYLYRYYREKKELISPQKHDKKPQAPPLDPKLFVKTRADLPPPQMPSKIYNVPNELSPLGGGKSASNDPKKATGDKPSDSKDPSTKGSKSSDGKDPSTKDEDTPKESLVTYEGKLIPVKERNKKMEEKYGSPLRFKLEKKETCGFVIQEGESGVKVYVIEGDILNREQEIIISYKIYRYYKKKAEFLEEKNQKKLSKEEELSWHSYLVNYARDNGLYSEMHEELLECYKLNPDDEKIRDELSVLLPGEGTAKLTDPIVFFPKDIKYYSIAWKNTSYQPNPIDTFSGSDLIFYFEKPQILSSQIPPLINSLPDPEVPDILSGNIKYLGRWYPKDILDAWLRSQEEPFIYQFAQYTVYSSLHEIDGELKSFFSQNIPKLVSHAERYFSELIEGEKNVNLSSSKWYLVVAQNPEDLKQIMSSYVPRTDSLNVRVLQVILNDTSEVNLLIYPVLQEIVNQLFSLYVSHDIPWARVGMAQMIALSYPDEEYQRCLFWDDAFCKILVESVFTRDAVFGTLADMKSNTAGYYSAPYHWFIFSFLYDEYKESLRIYLNKARQGQEISFTRAFLLPMNDKDHKIKWKKYALKKGEGILSYTASIQSLSSSHLLFFRDSFENLFWKYSLSEWIEFLIKRFSGSWSGMSQRIPSILEAMRYLAIIKEELKQNKDAFQIYNKLLSLYRMGDVGNPTFQSVIRELSKNCERLKKTYSD